LSVPAAYLRAESGTKAKRIGIVRTARNFVPYDEEELWLEFHRVLRQRGWVEGENLIVERRELSGDRGQGPEVMAELIALEVDVLFVTGVWAALAAKQATDRIPIVFAVGDPVGRGVVSNLARPERNLTGTSVQFVELQAKRVELLQVVAPGMKRVAALMNPELGYPPAMFNDANKPRGVEILILALGQIDDLDPAVARVSAQRVDAVLVAQGLASQHRDSLVGAVARLRLPTMYPNRNYVDLGGLLSFGVDDLSRARMNAALVDKILRGAKPADLPVEQPMAFDLAINLKTAKALGITVPRELLLRADWIVG
jgi:putative ABC transport system substrate-binding protein